MHLGWEGTLRGISRTAPNVRTDDGVGDTVFLLQEYMFLRKGWDCWMLDGNSNCWMLKGWDFSGWITVASGVGRYSE